MIILPQKFFPMPSVFSKLGFTMEEARQVLWKRNTPKQGIEEVLLFLRNVGVS